MRFELRNPFRKPPIKTETPTEIMAESQPELETNPPEEKMKKIEAVQAKMQDMLNEVVDGVLDEKLGGVGTNICETIKYLMVDKISRAYDAAGIEDKDERKSHSVISDLMLRHKVIIDMLKDVSDRKGNDDLKVAKQDGVESMGSGVFDAKIIFKGDTGEERILAERQFRAGNVISENNEDIYEQVRRERK